MARDLSARIVINAEDRTAAGLAATQRNFQALQSQVKNLQGQFAALLGLNIASILNTHVAALIRTADTYKSLEARLKLVSDNTKEYAIAQKELFNIAQRTRTDLEGTYTLYGRVETAIKQLGGTQENALKTTEAITKAIALVGGRAETQKNGLEQFNQALANGVLRGQEFNSVMLNTPGLAQAIAEGLDVPIGKLREMAEAGKLTTDKLVNALAKSAPHVAEQFAQIPITVSAAFQKLENAFTRYVGLADKANGASADLASGIQYAAQHLDDIAQVIKIVAELYGGKLLISLAKSTRAMIEGAAAAKAKAAADLEARQALVATLQTETQVLAIKIRMKEAAIEEARLQVALAQTERQRAQALKMLERAYRDLTVAQNAATARQGVLTAAIAAANPVISRADRAWNLLNNSLSYFVAFEVGQTIGEWATQFEKMRMIGSYVAETFTQMSAGLQSLFNGDTFSQRFAQIKQIHAEYDQVRQGLTDKAKQDAEQIAAAEDTKTKAIEQATKVQAESFKEVQAATAALTAQIDADAKRQTASIQQALAEKLAVIEASDVSESEKTQLRLQAQLTASEQELQLQTQIATEKLNLIDAEYTKEVNAAKVNTDRLNQIESEKRQAKLSVYTGLAEYYQGEINKLQGVFASEYAAAQQANQNLQQLQGNHQHALLEIQRLGMDDKHKLDSQESEYDKTIAALRAEQAKGKEASQSKLNDLLSQAKTLHGEITQAAVNGAASQSEKQTAIYEATKRQNDLYKVESDALKANAEAHERNAAAALEALEKTKAELSGVNDIIGTITRQLEQEMMAKIGIDAASLTKAQGIIADLVKPETKTITIQTIERKGGAAIGGGDAQTSDNVYSDANQKTGGMAGKPTFQIWRFMTGGYAPKTGKLPGYGGGDKIRALLEQGEFIMRKEAVKKFGEPFMYALNAGRIPLLPIRRAQGGMVGDESLQDLLAQLRELRKKRLELDKQFRGNFHTEYGRIAPGHEEEIRQAGQQITVVEKLIQDVLSKIEKTGNQASLLTYTDNIGYTSSYGKNDPLQSDFMINGQRENLNSYSGHNLKSLALNIPGITNDKNNKLTMPELPDSVRKFAQGGISQPTVVAPEVIKLDLSMNNQAAVGTFAKNDQTRALLQEIKRAGLASS